MRRRALSQGRSSRAPEHGNVPTGWLSSRSCQSFAIGKATRYEVLFEPLRDAPSIASCVKVANITANSGEQRDNSGWCSTASLSMASGLRARCSFASERQLLLWRA